MCTIWIRSELEFILDLNVAFHLVNCQVDVHIDKSSCAQESRLRKILTYGAYSGPNYHKKNIFDMYLAYAFFLSISYRWACRNPRWARRVPGEQASFSPRSRHSGSEQKNSRRGSWSNRPYFPNWCRGYMITNKVLTDWVLQEHTDYYRALYMLQR